MANKKLKDFYTYLNNLLSAESLASLLKDEVLAKAQEEGVEFTMDQLLSYIDSRLNKLDAEKQLDTYIKSLTAGQFKKKANEWQKEVKAENEKIEELLKKKISTKEELKEGIDLIKEAYEKALRRREYIKGLLKEEKDKDVKETLKDMIKQFDRFIKELDKIYEKKAKNLSKYMVKTFLGNEADELSVEKLKKRFVKLKSAKKDIMEIDAKIEIENISGSANARKVKDLKEQKRLKAEKMYYKTLAIKTAIEEDIEKTGADSSKDERIELIDRVANGFKTILEEEENALAKDKAYKQMLIDEGIEE